MRTCSTCKVEKSLDEFYRHRNLPEGRHLSCKSCQSDYAKRYNAQPENRAKQRALHLARYGLTPETFDALLEAQGRRCAICRADDPGGVGTWHIDHDHECCPERRRSCGGCVRGLLCMQCNHRVGIVEQFGDAISAYLRRER